MCVPKKLGPKICWSKNNLGLERILSAKNYLTVKKNFVPTNFGSKKFWVQQNFGTKKIWRGGQNSAVEVLGLYEAFIPNLGLLPSPEPSEKFSVVVGGVESDFSVQLWAKP